MIDKLSETCLFFNSSPKRESLLINIFRTDEVESQQKKPLLNMCKTCWAERHEAYNYFASCYRHIITCLEIIVHGHHQQNSYQQNLLGPWSPATKKRASSLLGALTDFGFIVAFISVHQALSHLHRITIKLQKRASDIVEAYDMVRYHLNHLKCTCYYPTMFYCSIDSRSTVCV